jgi:hypothetical protein
MVHAEKLTENTVANANNVTSIDVEDLKRTRSG